MLEDTTFRAAKPGEFTFKNSEWKIQAPIITWKWCFNGDWSFTVNQLGKPPNRFHRYMMRKMLGIHTEIIKPKE